MPRSLIHPSHAALPTKLRVATFRANFVDVLRAWQERRQHRAELCRLLTMGPNLIADMGMTVEEAETEAGLPFWKPRHQPESPFI